MELVNIKNININNNKKKCLNSKALHESQLADAIQRVSYICLPYNWLHKPLSNKLTVTYSTRGDKLKLCVVSQHANVLSGSL